MIQYSIRDWQQHFECSDTRKCKRLSWIPQPVRHDGKSYRRLMRMNPTHYLAWVLLVQVAANCPRRGTLADEDGPLSAEDLALKTDCPAKIFSDAFQPLCEVGWLVAEDVPEVSGNLPKLPEACGHRQTDRQTPLPDGKEEIVTGSYPHASGCGGGDMALPGPSPSTGQPAGSTPSLFAQASGADTPPAKGKGPKKATARRTPSPFWQLFTRISNELGRKVTMGPQNSAAAIRLGQDVPETEWDKIVRAYLADTSTINLENGHAVWWLERKIDKYRNAKPTTGDPYLDAADECAAGRLQLR